MSQDKPVSEEQMQDACPCRKARQRSCATVREAVFGVESDAILAGSEQIARSEEKWMTLYRCRTCGTFWTEACYSSGHMDFYYLFPAPPTDDPIRWLQEEAAELPPA